MNKFILLTVTFGLPLLVFLIAQDFTKGFYRAEGEGLSYVIVDPEELAAVEAAAAEEAAEAAAEAKAVEDEVAEAEPVEEVAEAVEEAPAADETPTAVEAPIQVVTLSDDEMKAAAREVRKCSTCHQLERDRNGVGPHLLGIVGRPVGSVDGFRYSDALKELGEAGQVWTQDELLAWLEGPSNYAPGTKMNFKVRDEEARRLIAGWLASNPSQ